MSIRDRLFWEEQARASGVTLGPALYLQGTTVYRGVDAAKADNVSLNHLTRRIDHDDGDVEIIQLRETPLQPGQPPWRGR